MLSKTQTIGLCSFIAGVLACAIPMIAIARSDANSRQAKIDQLEQDLLAVGRSTSPLCQITVPEMERVIATFKANDLQCNDPAVINDAIAVVNAWQSKEGTESYIAADVGYTSLDVKGIGPRGTVTVLNFYGSLPPHQFDSVDEQLKVNNRLLKLIRVVCGEMTEVAESMNNFQSETKEISLTSGWNVIVKHYKNPPTSKKLSRSILVQLTRRF